MPISPLPVSRPPMELLLLYGSAMAWGSGDGPVRSSLANDFSELLTETTKQSGIHFLPPAGLAGEPEETPDPEEPQESVGSGLSTLDRITQRDLIEGTKALFSFYQVLAFSLAVVAVPNPFRGYALSIVGDYPRDSACFGESGPIVRSA